ncbi:MAG: ImmA/IrrE family metallo-endopeptidase [Desulfobacterales bacterium]|nr:ImmA/IrrE family metallo-endopeptidase [Desulfobacterales bacterium]
MQIDKRKINILADKVRLALDMKTSPYDPEEAISKLGGSIEIKDINQDIDAILLKSGNDSFKIHLNDKSSNRNRFTLAHELGHLFLHMGFIIDREKWDAIDSFEDSVYFRSDTYSLQEFEANEFAASFLMPKEEFIEISEDYLNNNKYDLGPIADHFQVSVKAVENRGKWFGIFEW